MRQITNMVKTVRAGGGIIVDGWSIRIEPSYAGIESNSKLCAISEDGNTTLTTPLGRFFSNPTLKQAIETIVQDINSSTHLPKSSYKNGIRLDTEYRCQNSRCNPSGKRRLLFVSAGSMTQTMQIKCKCGWMNTFWKNRIGIDENGALFMKKK